ncbi:MAG: hypothetical protein U9R47_06685 [Actinomycetota bacterium]|nr:hypothetical protein [Actinomycetota bacterium]
MGGGMERNSGVGVALLASVIIMLGWFFLSVTAALIVTFLAGAGVVFAALTQRRRDS